MTVDEYVKDCWDKANDFVWGVEKNLILSNKWIKLAVKRHINDITRTKANGFEHKHDLIWKADEVEKVFKFFYFLNTNKDNIYQRFELLPYQAFTIMSIFGFYWKHNNRRRFKYSMLFMARKGGKSTFAAALQLYFLLGDGVQDPQSLLLASTREQATIALEYLKGLIYNSPLIAKRLDPLRNSVVFKDRTKLGFSKTLAANANKLDGYSCSGAILDEVHAYPDDSLFNVIKSSTGAREKAHIMLISTAGFKTSGLCYDLVQTGKNILEGKASDDSFFFLLFTLDDGDDFTNPGVWYKSNPGLGIINHLDDMMIEYEQAVNMPTQLSNFLTKHLNIFVNETTNWIRDEIVVDNLNDPDWNKYKGFEITIGMDMSQTRDLTALSYTLYDEDEQKYKSKTLFFMPKNAEKMLRRGGYNIKEWIREGHIIECQTPTIDYDVVLNKIKELDGNFKIIKVLYDKYNSSAIVPQLQKEDIFCEVFEQNTLKFNAPLKKMEQLLFERKMDLGNNPVLRWNFANVVLYNDGNANIKIMKNKSGDSVDGCVSLAMALGGYDDYMNPVWK